MNDFISIMYYVAFLKQSIFSSKSYRYLVCFMRKNLHFTAIPSWLKHHLCLIILVLVTFSSILGFLRIIEPYPLKGWIELRLTLEELGLAGAIVYVLLVAIMPLISPITILFITGSASFGIYAGMALSYIGALLNANLTFFLVKTLSIEEMWGKEENTARIKAGIKRNGFRLVLLLQLLLVIPFVAINSAAAAAGVHWKDFMKATSIGVLPSIVLYSFLGEVIASRFMSPEIYFSVISVVLLVIIVTALRKRNVHFGRKGIL